MTAIKFINYRGMADCDYDGASPKIRMKTKSLLNLWVSVSFGVIAAVAGPDNAAKVRGCVYDSRAVAFAYFWGEAASEKRNALVAQARAARAAGDQARFRSLDQSLRDLQACEHLKVFRTLPADEAMSALKSQVRALQIDLGLVRVVSK